MFLLFTVKCPDLSDPVNGIVVESGLTLASTATYVCDDGYNMVGDSHRICKKNGNWSGTIPTCEPGISTFYHPY